MANKTYKITMEGDRRTTANEITCMGKAKKKKGKPNKPGHIFPIPPPIYSRSKKTTE